MKRDTRAPYLRLLNAPEREGVEIRPNPDGVLLGFVDMSRVNESTLEFIMSMIRPAWIFDLRPVPYFDIGRFDRRRAFELFRQSQALYRDVAGFLRITERNDASLNSGAIGGLLREMLATRPMRAPVIVLVDDEETVQHAMHVIPPFLHGHYPWCPMAIDVRECDGRADLHLHANGETFALETKWLGDRAQGVGDIVQAFRIWHGEDLFALTLEFQYGGATQLALPNECAAMLAQHLDSLFWQWVIVQAENPSAARPSHAPRFRPSDALHVIASRVERVSVQPAANESLVISFFHPTSTVTNAIFSIDAARLLQAQLAHVQR
jgi:hypothetical protein